MRILHTSDWHLGRKLYGQERRGEFQSFLDWLTELLKAERVDSLIVAGDVFDSSTPPVWAQELYYRFLAGLRGTPCRSAVIVAGNHDSAALLDAPKGLLNCLDIHVVGTPAVHPAEEVFELPGSEGKAGALCCAVPFLRLRDLCTPASGETPDITSARALEGFRARYRQAAEEAEARRGGRDLPIVATGHCFAAGGLKRDDGVRDLSVGSIEAVPLSAFPETVDYLALGHLHLPQTCSGAKSRRYSGSPICMGFGEAGQQKQVLIVDFEGRRPSVRIQPVPCWQELRRLAGSFDEIAARLAELEMSRRSVWVEADCTDGGQSLYGRIQACLQEGSPVQVLRVKAAGVGAASALSGDGDLNEDWSPLEVFRLYLEEHHIEGDEAGELAAAYRQALEAVLSEEAAS